MYLTCCLWYITRSHTSSLICCVWLQRSQATSDWVLVMYTHTPCDLVRFTWPTFCPSADKLSTRSTNLHLKLENFWTRNHKTPTLQQAKKSGIPGAGLVQCQHISPLARMAGAGCWGFSEMLCMQPWCCSAHTAAVAGRFERGTSCKCQRVFKG